MIQQIRNALPSPVAAVLRVAYRYLLGLWYWVLVLRQVRGDGLGETLKLITSALAAPFVNLMRLGKWQYPFLLRDTRIVVPGVGRFECEARTDQLFQVIPSGQEGVRRELETRLRPGAVFVDAGANLGFFTVLASRLVGATGSVISVEMMPQTAAKLKRHVAINGLQNVRIVQQALSERSGDQVIARQPVGRGGQATISVADVSPEDYTCEQSVTTVSLDDLLSTKDRIDLIKIDVEGHEAMVFVGGEKTLGRTQAVVLEYWPDDQRSTIADDHLRAAGFTVRILDEANKIAERLHV